MNKTIKLKIDGKNYIVEPREWTTFSGKTFKGFRTEMDGQGSMVSAKTIPDLIDSIKVWNSLKSTQRKKA